MIACSGMIARCAVLCALAALVGCAPRGEDMRRSMAAERARCAVAAAPEMVVRLHMLYPRLALPEGGLIAGGVVRGDYYADIPVRGQELQELRRIISRMTALPSKRRADEKNARPWPIQDAGAGVEAMGSMELMPAGVCGSLGSLPNFIIPGSFVRASEAAVLRLAPDEGAPYVLPDADYAALLALPSVRKAFEWMKKYKDAPAPFFKNREKECTANRNMK